MQPLPIMPDTNTVIFKDYLTPWLYVRYSRVSKGWCTKIEGLARDCLIEHKLPIFLPEKATKVLQGIIKMHTARFIEAVKDKRVSIALNLLRSGTVQLDATHEGKTLYDWSIANDPTHQLGSAFFRYGGDLSAIQIKSHQIAAKKWFLPHLTTFNCAFTLLGTSFDNELFNPSEIFKFFEGLAKAGNFAGIKRLIDEHYLDVKNYNSYPLASLRKEKLDPAMKAFLLQKGIQQNKLPQ